MLNLAVGVMDAECLKMVLKSQVILSGYIEMLGCTSLPNKDFQIKF